MCRLAISLIAATAVFLAFTTLVSAQEGPTFKLGFRALADQIPDVVGEPSENEHSAANGDSIQQTTTGLMVWRKADNWTAFTDGARTWIHGPNGVESRSNNDLLSWESPLPAAAPQPPPPPSTTPLPTPTSGPATAGYGYIDPGVVASNPSAYVGQKVVLQGSVGRNVWPNGASYIELYPDGFYPKDIWRAPWFGVQLSSMEPKILRFDSIRVYGTITGQKTETIRQPGQLPYIITSMRMTGDRWEPIPPAGGETRAGEHARLLVVLLGSRGATIEEALAFMGFGRYNTNPLANYYRRLTVDFQAAFWLQHGGSEPLKIQSPADYVRWASELLESLGGSLGNIRGQVMSALGAAPGQSQGWNTMFSGIDPSTGEPYLTDQERRDWVNRLLALVDMGTVRPNPTLPGW